MVPTLHLDLSILSFRFRFRTHRLDHFDNRMGLDHLDWFRYSLFLMASVSAKYCRGNELGLGLCYDMGSAVFMPRVACDSFGCSVHSCNGCGAVMIFRD